MNWAGWSEFWNMGGYGLYVWGSYVVTLLCMLAETVLVRQHFGGVLRRLARARHAAEKGTRDETET